MTPYWFHEAPLNQSALASLIGGPPDRFTLFSSFWLAKKPSWLPSGDQKGVEAPSVPARGRVESWSRERSNKRPPVAIARCRPSGDSANRPPASACRLVPRGREIDAI